MIILEPQKSVVLFGAQDALPSHLALDVAMAVGFGRQIFGAIAPAISGPVLFLCEPHHVDRIYQRARYWRDQKNIDALELPIVARTMPTVADIAGAPLEREAIAIEQIVETQFERVALIVADLTNGNPYSEGNDCEIHHFLDHTAPRLIEHFGCSVLSVFSVNTLEKTIFASLDGVSLTARQTIGQQRYGNAASPPVWSRLDLTEHADIVLQADLQSSIGLTLRSHRPMSKEWIELAVLGDERGAMLTAWREATPTGFTDRYGVPVITYKQFSTKELHHV